MFDDTTFEETTVLITGGGTGIGRGMALTFARHGATVGVAARRDEPLQETVEAIEAEGGDASWRNVDIREQERVEDCVEGFWEEWGRIDVLINNAGANFISPAAATSPNGWETIVDINLNGTFRMSRAVGQKMMGDGQGGRIINLSATNAEGGSPMIAHSGASKAGINSLTESLAVEWGPAGITVNAILPGPVRTEGSDKQLWQDEELVEQMESQIPLGRFGTPDDIAPLAMFLASDAGAFVNGALIPCDGGDRLRSPNFGG
jgi:NAD(P)-dependent dehydrogenase (short-subunit alcohol dehydrogenase family)